jgi:hypothetical protein
MFNPKSDNNLWGLTQHDVVYLANANAERRLVADEIDLPTWKYIALIVYLFAMFALAMVI